MKNKRISISVSQSEATMIRELANKNGLTISQLMTSMLKQYPLGIKKPDSAVLVQEVINTAYDLIEHTCGLSKISDDKDALEKLDALRKLGDEAWEF